MTGEQHDATGDEQGGGVDRRSLLKKAAIGGAVAWVAPTVLSSGAHAQGSGGPAIIGGFVVPNSNVNLEPTGNGSPAVRAVVIGPSSDSTIADESGYYEFTAVEPGYEYCVEAVCEDPENPQETIGCVASTEPGVYYDISCPGLIPQ